MTGNGWDTTALDAFVQWAEATGGTQVLVLDHGETVVEWTSDPTPLDIASAQKSVVSVMLGILVARGEVDLDAPASRWLGDRWTKATPEQEAAITVRHLATMVSGLYDDFSVEAPPGTTWYYNNNGYHQVRRILEIVTDSSSGELSQDLLFGPLGMADSSWVDRPMMKDPAGVVIPGMHSTAADLGRFGLAVLEALRGERDLGCTQAYLQMSMTPATPLNDSYGLLWWLFGGQTATTPGVPPGGERQPKKFFGGIDLDQPIAPSAPADAIGAMGAGNQRLLLVPSRDVVVVRLGRPVGEMTAAAGGFDVELWDHLTPAMPTTAATS